MVTLVFHIISSVDLLSFLILLIFFLFLFFFLFFLFFFFFFQAEDGIRDLYVTGVQTCALPIYCSGAMRCFSHSISFSYFVSLSASSLAFTVESVPSFSPSKPEHPRTGQIGRASCRERV